ncbi:hypothetical protein [Nonlabens antarcticus]|uniref:hypothetical protein n=1 Tax=Nonlabens antarcticus TaxID=392714 RepID=UPI0018910190|nr:hypothetical protein [Nonlabens antarcticus]
MRNIFLTLLMGVVLASCGSTKGKDKVSENFKISILEVNNGTVKLECTEGCAWTELSWTKNNNRSQVINAYGMADESNEEINLSDDLPEFKFRIVPTDNGATLESLYGTAWKTLSFSCTSDCNHYVDFKGITTHNRSDSRR